MYIVSCVYREIKEGSHIGKYVRVYIIGVYNNKIEADSSYYQNCNKYNENKEQYCKDVLKFDPNRVGHYNKDRTDYNINFRVSELQNNQPRMIYLNPFNGG